MVPADIDGYLKLASLDPAPIYCYLMLAIFACSGIPAIMAIIMRKTMIKYLKSRGRNERRFWNISFIMALRATDHSIRWPVS